jgi:hypothetical protein
MFDQSVTRVRAGTRTDRAGNTIPDWDLAERTVIAHLSVQPTVQDETGSTGRPSLVITGWHVLSEPGTAPDVLPADRFRFDGITCEVDGEVARWPDSDGGVHHLEFALKRVTG